MRSLVTSCTAQMPSGPLHARKIYSSLRRTLALCGALAVTGLDSAALAQESTTEDLLETVIVTASRVPASAQVLPTAWSALDQPPSSVSRHSTVIRFLIVLRVAGSAEATARKVSFPCGRRY